MFRKLFKQEWQATWKPMTILSCGLVVLCLAYYLAYQLFAAFYTDFDPTARDNLTLLVSLCNKGLSLLAFAYLLAIPLLLAWRFYRHKFTDRGYLTFTLPVNARQLYWSHMVNAMLWSFLSLVTASLALGLTKLSLFPPSLWNEIFYFVKDIVNSDMSAVDLLCAFLSILGFLCLWLWTLSFPLVCVTLGCTTAKRHKILASVGYFYALVAAVVVGTVILFWVLFYLLALLSMWLFPNGDGVGTGFVCIIIAAFLDWFLSLLSQLVAGYCIVTRRMKKLNLS